MKKAIIIGGSNGIGLALSAQLIHRGYFVEILDRVPPEKETLPSDSFHYISCNLLDFNETLFSVLAADPSVQVLVITAGIGRIADFQYFHLAEIEKTFTINTLAAAKILRIFYPRIQSQTEFYCGVMGSIAGWLNSPAAALYASSKAGLCRLVESVNIELEAGGTPNRILDVSPASFKGSKFYGGKNDLALTASLAQNILQQLFTRRTLFIPQYEEMFKGVLARYHADAHEYGLHSYQYKKDSGRLNNIPCVVIGYLSGTFDLFHVGHLNLLRRAKEQCDYLIVGVHDNGKWKGKETFIPLEERKTIVAACKYVDKVVDSCREDCDAWPLWHYHKLFVGSDYKGTERFNRYEAYFKDKGVEIVYFPYTKSTSSTQIRKAILAKEDASNSQKAP